MSTPITLLIILLAILLSLTILIQNPKGGAISNLFGGSSVTNLIGFKRSTHVIEKTTWLLGISIAALLIFNSIITL
jgi:preprotein translocase subunit SecG